MLVDSSIFIAYFHVNDSQHEKASVLLDTLFHQGNYFYITDFVFSEIITVLTLRANYEIAKKVAIHFMNNDQIYLIDTGKEIFHTAFSEFCNKKTKLSFVDIHLIQVAQEKKMGLVTFDRELEKAYKKCYESS